MSNRALAEISRIIIDETQPPQALQQTLDKYSRLCAEITGITPDPGFTRWADDTLLASGVAINPQSAAFCLKDYQRSIVFMRGIYAAILDIKSHTSKDPVNILYAGCSPFASLILPLLTNFKEDDLNLFLLDIHQASLDSVHKLLSHFALDKYKVMLIQGDASCYKHPHPLDLIVAEVMQKALEQEPQFSVTANLAPQLCHSGIFIPQAIHVSLCLAHWKKEKEAFLNGKTKNFEQLHNRLQRHRVADLVSLLPANAASLQNSAIYNNATSKYEIALGKIRIPDVTQLDTFDALLLTNIEVYRQHKLEDYSSEITLPHKCYELSPLLAGAIFNTCYQLGGYPKFEFTAAD